MDNSRNLIKYLSKFSSDDLAKSFFVLNLWLPNVASQIKSQLLYVILEAITKKLPNVNKIKDYEDFKVFSEKVISLIPSFSYMEDYVPESDWGEIKYFHNERYYKVFYGGDLSNTCDWYYQFEALHLGFDDFYLDNVKRSPSKELEFCLSIQTEIISRIPQSSISNENINPGDFQVPSKDFWLNSISFLDNFDPIKFFGEELVTKYTRNLGNSKEGKIPSEEEFINQAHKGENCFYFFIKTGDNIFPVLPRKFLSVLFDTWGDILDEFYPLLKLQNKYPELNVSFEVSKFIEQRVNEKHVFSTISIIKPDLHAHKTVFASAFTSKNKIVLIHILPPKLKDINYDEKLKELASEYNEIEEILSMESVKIGLLRESKMVGFNSSDETNQILQPFFITCFPFLNTSSNFIEIPKELRGETITLEQLLGIFDEIENLGEIVEFFHYKTAMISTSPMSSDLDLFGSFRDSSSVLVRGAIEFNFIMIDPHWGSDFRYRSLSEFWKNLPETHSLGHPRGWSIVKDSIKDKSLLLNSKTFLGYIHVLKMDKAIMFIKSPVDRLDFAQVQLTELLMDGLEDAFLHYENLLSKLRFTQNDEEIHILFFTNLLLESKEFTHLRHLSTETSNWKMDIARLPEGKKGIRIVYNENILRNLLQNAEDRSLQIELLLDVLQQLNSVFDDANFAKIEKVLENEKNKKNRYRIFSAEKTISFPDLSKHILPEIREYKLADKEIAFVASNNSISEGIYEGEVAKEKIRQLIADLVGKIDEEVKNFNLKSSIPKLISNIDSLTDDHEQEQRRVKNSLSQEVNYERSIKSSEGKLEFLRHYNSYKYLIEKFTQLQPQNNNNLTDQKTAELIALADRLLHLYSVSDNLHYGIYPATLIISSDFFVETEYNSVDITEMQKKSQQEQANLNLGIIGNNDDRNLFEVDNEQLMSELNQSFENDLGFTFTNLISVQRIFSSWAYFDSTSNENTYYRANQEKILEVCKANLEKFEEAETIRILNFLTLDDKELLLIEGNSSPAPDLPVWEHRKRTYRYTLRPLIKIEEEFYWGAHSSDRAAQLWFFSMISNHKLPSDITAPATVKILDNYHTSFTIALQEKIKEIISRLTPFVETEVFPMNLGFCNEEIGDIDVFALLKEKNILINIESKVIDQAYSNKDLKRLSEKIFGRIKSDGSFKGGYLQKVERRADLLKEKGDQIVEKMWKETTNNLKVVSIFVTPDSYWWTKYPPIETEVNFVEIRMLEDFINSF